MEEIFTERFNSATITHYKDYCRISDKQKYKDAMNGEIDFLSWDKPSVPSSKLKGSMVSFPEKRGKRKVNFFNEDNEVQQRFFMEYAGKPTYDTTKNRHIIKHYGDKLSEITVKVVERTIVRRGDKITIKSYSATKSRSFNSIYFRKSSNSYSLTINLKTGNFTTMISVNSSKVKTKKFRTNSFSELIRFIKSDTFFRLSKNFSSYSTLIGQIRENFNDKVFSSTITNVLGFQDTNVNYGERPEELISQLMDTFIKLKNIKSPNEEFEYLLTELYPTEKFLKKNDRKLIASVLDMLGIKSKLTIKILHENPGIDIFALHRFVGYFDKDYNKYVGNINENIFKNSYRKTSYNNMGWTTKSQAITNKNSTTPFNLKDVEKENLIKIVNSLNGGGGFGSPKSIDYNLIQLIDDHINMINTIKQFNPEISINSKNISEFNTEHSELSKMVAAINKGWVIEYQYDKKTIDEIETPLDCLYDNETLHVLYPKILRREEEYSEEGSYMHHCVASYANKDTSIIISLRDKDNSNRVTCEFHIETGKCLQERSFCNAKPPATFEDGLLLLREKVLRQARWGTLSWKEKKKVPVKINGVEIVDKLPTVRVTDIFEDVALPFQF
jgi:hypothetical protein